MYARILDLAGLRMDVIDVAEVRAEPMGTPDSVRDSVGRRFPAHLDVVAASPWANPSGQGGFNYRPVAASVGRRRRGARSLAEQLALGASAERALATQHPTSQQVMAQRNEWREQVRERTRLRSIALSRSEGPTPTLSEWLEGVDEADELDEVDELDERVAGDRELGRHPEGEPAFEPSPGR